MAIYEGNDMGLPTAAVGGGLQLAGGIPSLIGGIFGNSFERKYARSQQKLATRAAAQQYGAISASVAEAEARSGLEVEQIAEQSLRATGSVQAAAGAAGVRGASIDQLYQDFRRQEGRAVMASRLNLQFAREQAQREAEGVRLGLESRLAMTATQNNTLSTISGGLGIFGGALGTTLDIDQAIKNAGGNTFIL